jgi:hypothetical protein
MPALLSRLVCSLLAIGLPILLVACSPTVGDSCAKNTDCGRTLICDTAMPGGYCTVTPCLPNGCPDESICVDFGLRRTYCMRPCADDGDCRSEYACVTDQGPVPFCGLK